MIRRLIILLLIVGCEENGITSNGLTDGTAVTDTLYIFNYDTLIVTNYDTLIINNYDTTIVINYDTLIITNYDTTFVYDTLTITNNDTIVVMDTIYIETENYEVISVDWILIKNAEYVREESGDVESGEVFTYAGIGYTFLGTNSISNDNLLSIDIDGILNFEYESELYSFDLSDSYNEEAEEYFITANSFPSDVVNIYCYDNMSYCHIIQDNGLGYILDLSSPFEVIDYR